MDEIREKFIIFGEKAIDILGNQKKSDFELYNEHNEA